jgi:hypothetical protein
MISRWAFCALCSLALVELAQAQDAVAPKTATTVASANDTALALPGPCCTVPGGTVIELELTQPVNSKIQKRGEKFGLRLASPVTMGTTVVLPAGTEGVGEIIDAAPSGAGGAPGKLLLAGRYLSWNGTQIPLRGMKLGGAGKNLGAAALGVSFAAGPFAMFVHGGNIELPVGTRAEAKIAVDTAIASPAPETLSAGTPRPPSGAAVQGPPSTVIPDSQNPTHQE